MSIETNLNRMQILLEEYGTYWGEVIKDDYGCLLSRCPNCLYMIRVVGKWFAEHDIDGLEPNCEEYFSGQNVEGVGHIQCLLTLADRNKLPKSLRL